MSPRFALVLTLAASVPGVGCGTAQFNDDFEADVAGVAPVSPPPGDPADDSLSLQGPPGSIVVIDSVTHGSLAVQLQRPDKPPPTVFDCVTGGGPHNSGNYFVIYKAYSPAIASPPLTVTLRSSTGQRAFELVVADGDFRLSSGDAVNDVVGGGYAANVVHTIRFRIDMTASRLWMAVDAAEVATEKPFLDAGFADVHLLRFQYPAPLLEALPASYVIDDIVIRK